MMRFGEVQLHEAGCFLQASTIGQMETSKWIDMFDLDKHVATIRECYRKRAGP
ncbi:MAG: hypothetical protein ACLUNQ_07410 [Oscillospiraceae bacterium]